MSGTSGIPGAAIEAPFCNRGAGAPLAPRPPHPPSSLVDTVERMETKLNGIDERAQRNRLERVFLGDALDELPVSTIDGRPSVRIPVASAPTAGGSGLVTGGVVFDALDGLLARLWPAWVSDKNPNYYHGAVVAYKNKTYVCTASHYATNHDAPDVSGEWTEQLGDLYTVVQDALQKKLDNYGFCRISSSGRLTVEGHSTYSTPERLVLVDDDTGDTLRMFGRPMSHAPGVAFFTFTSAGTTHTYWLPGASGTFALVLQTLPLDTTAPKFREDKPYAAGDVVTVDAWSPHGYGSVVAVLRFTRSHPAGPLVQGYEPDEDKDYKVVDMASLIAERAAKPSTFTAGNLAAFDADGNLVDTGYHISTEGGTPHLVATT